MPTVWNMRLVGTGDTIDQGYAKALMDADEVIVIPLKSGKVTP